MAAWMKASWSVVVCAVLSAATTAQTLTVPNDLIAGRAITVRYSDPDRAGQTITVEIDSAGFPSMIVVERQVTLDDQGNGSFEWTVPEWLVANFNAPGVGEVTRFIAFEDRPTLAVRGEPTASAGPATVDASRRDGR